MKIVTDSILVLGLDKLYRDQMKLQETLLLLPAARRVTRALGIGPAPDVAEGYYGETNELVEYFGLMRALQNLENRKASKVEAMSEYRLLDQVCSSRLYGFRAEPKGILHVGRDSLAEALEQDFGSWELNGLTRAAAAIAVAEDDYSLVGLAARTKDAICITATRESVVLYEMLTLGFGEEPTCEWAVTPEMQESASRFVAEFRGLFHAELPEIKAENAQSYYSAYEKNFIWGRCVRIGSDRTITPNMNYHWKIDSTKDGNVHVSEFWSSELWTTERYRAQLTASGNAPWSSS